MKHTFMKILRSKSLWKQRVLHILENFQIQSQQLGGFLCVVVAICCSDAVTAAVEALRRRRRRGAACWCLQVLLKAESAPLLQSRAAEHGDVRLRVCRTGFLPLTQSGATFKAGQGAGPPLRQSSLSTHWSSPFSCVYFQESVRPWGVCWGKVRNAKYLFFFSVFILLLSSFLSAAQPGEPEILSKHPDPAAL